MEKKSKGFIVFTFVSTILNWVCFIGILALVAMEPFHKTGLSEIYNSDIVGNILMYIWPVLNLLLSITAIVVSVKTKWPRRSTGAVMTVFSAISLFSALSWGGLMLLGYILGGID